MGSYKYSRFNIIAEESDDLVLLYNTYTLRYRYVDRVDLDDIYEKKDIDLGDVPVIFAEEGFIVPDGVDEIRRLKADVRRHFERSDFMFISVFVTLACNYRCSYCFEKEHLSGTEHMTRETAEEVVDFINRRYKEHPFSKPLRIKWFGGEPLLNMDIIRFISGALKREGTDFAAKLYTNGRFLSRQIAEELKELGVTDEVVIPLDGTAPNYARLKGCSEADFYETLKNIKNAEDILKTVIHINVSEETKEDALPLLKLLREEFHIGAKIVPINVAPQNTDCIRKDNSIGFDDFRTVSDRIRSGRAGGIRRAYGCEGRHPDYYVVGTKGELYICEHLIGQKEHQKGNIRDLSGRIDRHGTIWDSDRIIDECSGCPLLPLCLGRCTSQRYLDHIDCEKEKRIKAVKERIMALAREAAVRGSQPGARLMGQ